MCELRQCARGGRAGHGSVLVVRGPAGIGKTVLLEEARRRAGDGGATVVFARAGELETGFPYGVVRQLFEADLRAADAAHREAFLGGAAALAAPALLGPVDGTPPPADAGFSIVHGLYWLAANRAARAPLAVIVDDAHWSDPPSLRFLAYLARRLDGLPITLIVSARTGEDGSDPQIVHELAGGPGAEPILPASLTQAAVETLLADAFQRRPDPEFARTCRYVTGGNPYLVRELAVALIADRVEPAADAVERLQTVGPATIARTTLGRIGHLSTDAVRLARAIAILGGDATLPRAARLADTEQAEALVAFDALLAANVVSSTDRLEFVHPIVRTALYEEIAPGERSLAHRRVAEQLSAEGAEIDLVAGHLLHAAPIGSTDTVATLRAAAAHAIALGAPDSAATYLERALREDGDRDERARLLLELAAAEKLARDPAAVAHLAEAIRIGGTAATRAAAMTELAEVLVYAGEWGRSLELFDAVLAEQAGGDSELALRANVLRTLMTAYDPRLVAGFEARRDELDERARTRGPAARPLMLTLAGVGANRGDDRRQMQALFEQGWDEGRFMSDFAGDAPTLAQGLWALIGCGELDRASEVLDVVRDNVEARGSLIGFIMASVYGTLIAARRGDLPEAEAELRTGCEHALDTGALFALPSFLHHAIDVLLERPDAADLAALAETIELGPMAEVSNGALVFEVRGRLLAARGEGEAAIAQLRRAGAIYAALGFRNANMLAWRSALALALPPSDRAEAIDLAAAELADARGFGAAHGIGVALRTLALVEPSVDAAIDGLRDAVAVLADSPSRLEHARSLVELGAMLRRRGDRTAARGPLRNGLDMAARCGAVRLAERARTELGAAGAKPRRLHVTGRDALTASELRVAKMAAAGQTSTQIAQALFVTTKTVDAHLQHTYSKLGIHSRRELSGALEEPAAKDW